MSHTRTVKNSECKFHRELLLWKSFIDYTCCSLTLQMMGFVTLNVNILCLHCGSQPTMEQCANVVVVADNISNILHFWDQYGVALG